MPMQTFKATVALCILCGMHGSLLYGQSTSANTMNAAPTVEIDDVGDVGLRIADAQQLVEKVMSHFRARLGYDFVSYAGHAKAMHALKQLGATPEGYSTTSDIQTGKKYSWRIRLAFAQIGEEETIAMECLHRISEEAKTQVKSHDAHGQQAWRVEDILSVKAKHWAKALEALQNRLNLFCPLLKATTPASVLPATGVPLPVWQPPPRRG